MIFLDTNTLYYACGISENAPCNIERLNTIIKEQEIVISIATLYEFVLKWRNEIDKIHIIGKFLGDNQIKVAGNPYYHFPNKFPLGWNVISNTMIEEFIDQILPNKVDVEARLSAIVFSICFISIADFRVSDDSPNVTSGFYMDALRLIMKMMNEADIEVFINVFQEGYATTDCENYVKKCFDNYMEFWLQCFVPLLKKANEVETYDEYVTLEQKTDWAGLSSQISKKICKSQTTMEFIKKKARQHWKNMKDDHLKEFLGNLRNSIDKKIPYESIQEYLTDIVSNILLNGSAFWKNDIIDAIIMSHIRTDEDILITFDEIAIEHMKKHKEEHPIYVTSLQMIANLKKES